MSGLSSFPRQKSLFLKKSNQKIQKFEKQITCLACPATYVYHNPIFTRGIFSGVGTQNETIRTKPAWSDKGLPH